MNQLTSLKTDTLQVGDICVATYSYSSQHNYWLVVTKRTAKTVSFKRIAGKVVTDDGYGQNGSEVAALDGDGNPVPYPYGDTQYNNKRIKVYDGQEVAKIGDYISYARKWNGKTREFYTD